MAVGLEECGKVFGRCYRVPRHRFVYRGALPKNRKWYQDVIATGFSGFVFTWFFFFARLCVRPHSPSIVDTPRGDSKPSPKKDGFLLPPVALDQSVVLVFAAGRGAKGRPDVQTSNAASSVTGTPTASMNGGWGWKRRRQRSTRRKPESVPPYATTATATPTVSIAAASRLLSTGSQHHRCHGRCLLTCEHGLGPPHPPWPPSLAL